MRSRACPAAGWSDRLWGSWRYREPRRPQGLGWPTRFGRRAGLLGPGVVRPWQGVCAPLVPGLRRAASRARHLMGGAASNLRRQGKSVTLVTPSSRPHMKSFAPKLRQGRRSRTARDDGRRSKRVRESLRARTGPLLLRPEKELSRSQASDSFDRPHADGRAEHGFELHPVLAFKTSRCKWGPKSPQPGPRLLNP